MLSKLLLALVVVFAMIIGVYTFFRDDGTAVTHSNNQSFTQIDKGRRGDDPIYSEEIKRNTALTMQAKERADAIESKLVEIARQKKQDDLKAKQVQDRLAFMQKELDKKIKQLGEQKNTTITDNVAKQELTNKVDEMRQIVSQMQKNLQEANQNNAARIQELESALIIAQKSNQPPEQPIVQSESDGAVTYAYGIGQNTPAANDRDKNVLSGLSDRLGNFIDNGEIRTESGKIPYYQKNEEDKEWETVFPVYTLPQNTVLADSTLITPIIGRIPLGNSQGNITDPFFFKVEIGSENIAANGHKIPGVSKIIASGYSTGVREQSCARGYIDSLTFIFVDGRIVTHGQSSGEGNSNSDTLGYLSDQWGKPCIRGNYLNNAKNYLMSRGLAAFVEAAAGGLSQSQVQTQQNAEGGSQAILNGNVWQYVLGQGVSGSASELAEYVRERTANAFDVIYVEQAKPVQIWLSKQINIDYDAKARKINYYEQQTSQSAYD